MKPGQMLRSAWGWKYRIKTVEGSLVKLIRIHDDGREQLDVWTDKLGLYTLVEPNGNTI